MSRTEARAVPREGPPRDVQQAAKLTEPRSHVTVARGSDEAARRVADAARVRVPA
jgi:hypothetical protein